MKLYAAIDLHANNNVVVVIDEKDERALKPTRLPNDAKAVLDALEPYRTALEAIAVESTYNGYWLIDALQGAGYTVKLVHTPAIRQYEGLKYGNDDSDAFHLAHLLRLGILKTGYICPQPVRALRDLMRRRRSLVQQHTRTLLSVRSMYERVLGRVSRELSADQITLDFAQSADRLAARVLWETSVVIADKVDELERWIRAELKGSAPLVKLRTIPGVGWVLGPMIQLETGDVSRFESVGDYASYCRLVDATRWSNDKCKGRGNRKCGNGHLCWAWIEAANYAIRADDQIRKWYQRKLKQVKLRVIAIKAVAHKLARAAYHMLRDNTSFDVHRAFN